ncbi:MAG: transglycosylase SLT domain-containing protein [Betaproteobacteria bacterium]
MQAKSVPLGTQRSSRSRQDSVKQYMSRPVSPMDYARAFVHRGEALLDLGLHAEALISFERALGFDPQYVLAHLGRAKTLAAMQQHQAALQIYDRMRKDESLLRQDPDLRQTIEQAILALHEQALPPTDRGTVPVGEKLRSIANQLKLPRVESRWYRRAVPVLGLALTASLVTPFIEAYVSGFGLLKANDSQVIAALPEAEPTMAAPGRDSDRAKSDPSEADLNQRTSAEGADQQVADAAYNASRTLRYRPSVSAVHSGQAKPLAKAVRPLDPGQRDRIANYIVEQFRSKPNMARAVVHEAVLVGKQLQLDPLLLLAIIAVESRFDPMAQSNRGAQGLMQVRTSVHSARFDPFGGVSAAFDFATNIRIGAQILQEHLTRHGSVDLALKHYVGAARMAHDQGYAAKVRKEKLKLEQIWLQAAVSSDQPKHEGS